MACCPLHTLLLAEIGISLSFCGPLDGAVCQLGAQDPVGQLVRLLEAEPYIDVALEPLFEPGLDGRDEDNGNNVQRDRSVFCRNDHFSSF